MIRRSTLIAVEVVLGLVAAFAIGIAVAWWRLSQGPIELNSIRDHVEAELSAARSGRPVGIERVELAWSQRNALELRAIGVTVEDAQGGVLSRSEEARIELGVLPLLIGRVSLVRAEFSGGALTVTRKPDGAMHIAFGPEGAPADIIIPARNDNETLEQRVARMLDGLEEAFRPVGPGGGVRGLAVRNAALTIIDESGGGRWTADSSNLELARRGRTLAFAADARLEGAEGLTAPASLRITTDTRFQSAVIEFGAQDARPRALFSPAALGPFAGLDAPMTTTVSVGLDRRRGVTLFEGDVVFGRGEAEMAGGRFSMEGGRVHGRYDIESDELIIDQLSLNGDRTRVGGEMRLRNVSAILRADPNEPAAFDISLPSVRFDVPATFSEPVALANVRVVGEVDSAQRTIRFTQVSAQNGQATLTGAGRLYWAEANPNRPTRTGVEFNGQVAGAVDARTAIHMWPVGLGEGAREFLVESIQGGQVTDATVRIDIRPTDLTDDDTGFRAEAIDVRFNVTDGALRFLDTMSPLTNITGSAVVRGNSFNMTASSARINNLAVSNASVVVPRFKPKGDMLTITASAAGEARNMVELLLQEPLSLGDRLPVETASIAGRGNVTLRLQRPLLSDVPFEDWRFTVNGQLRDLAANMTERRGALSNGQLTVRGDQRAVTISGPIRAGTSQIQNVRWTENIARGRAGQSSSEYQISGDFDANDLERLGYPVARYAQGRVGVTVNGQGRGFDVDNARIDLDLTNAAIEIPRQFWTKRAGQAASARFNVQRQSDGGLLFTDLDARGAGLNAQGRVRLTRDEHIQEADLTRLVIEGRSDARLTAIRAADGGLDVNVRGALFDAAPFMGSEPAPAGATPASAASTPPPAPLRATVAVSRLKLRGGATMSDARVNLVMLRGALASLTAEGRSPRDRAFSLGLGPRADDPQGRIRLRSDDAGFAVAALTGMDNIVGGTASADGDWRGGPPSQARFTVRMNDFNVVRLPAMAQLLSSAGSLTGFVDTLNGDGIGFSVMEAEMAYANDRVTFTEGSMRGPALGLTGSGSYDINRDNLDVDGVVAPSPGLNLSMLGEVPVLGNLLVSRRGEGVFGMTYSINGQAAEPRTFVNPMSALTPGILRRIFEPPPPPRDAGGSHSLPPPDAEAVAAARAAAGSQSADATQAP